MGKNTDDELLSINQAAEIAGVRRETIWRWRIQGKLPTVEIAGKTFVRRGDLAEMRPYKRSGRQA